MAAATSTQVQLKTSKLRQQYSSTAVQQYSSTAVQQYMGLSHLDASATDMSILAPHMPNMNTYNCMPCTGNTTSHHTDSIEAHSRRDPPME